MESKTKGTTIKRFLAFIFDFIFIMLLAYTVYMLFGLFFKLDSEGYQNYMSLLLLIVIISYLTLGELIFKNSLGKYLFGIEIVDKEKLKKPSFSSFIKRGLSKIFFPVEGLILLLSRKKERLGDIWSKSIVVKKETSRTSPSAKFFIGVVVLIALVFSSRIAMGFSVRHADFYKIGKDYLETRYDVKIDGLTKVVDQKRNSVNFIVPVSSENNDRHGIVYLNRNVEGWRADSARFTKEHILGFSYGMSYGKAR